MAQDLAFKTLPLVRPLAALAVLTMAGPAAAQSMATNSASYNAGWSRVGGSENRAIALASARDAAGNRTIIDGVIQTGAETVSSRAYDAGQSTTSGGVGSAGRYGTAVAAGNSLNVSTYGNYNTVIVNSTQTNTGDITAIVSGGVGE